MRDRDRDRERDRQTERQTDQIQKKFNREKTEERESTKIVSYKRKGGEAEVSYSYATISIYLLL